MNNSSYIRFAWATLVVLFLVIIAGSVVRMTGSGMGCPDWPKCFGYFIPPTQEEQVQFQPNTAYEKGQMIIHDNDLVSANKDFTTEGTYNDADWSVYEKHDYAIFNPAHTWTEYINRLFGALSGLFVLILFIWTIVKVAKGKLPWWLILLTFFNVLLLGFQAWLGKTVVDSHLSTAKITLHMVGALALILLMLIIIRAAKQPVLALSAKAKWLVGLSLALLLVQVYLGTEFRVLVDESSVNQIHTDETGNLFNSFTFKIHRSFAWLVLIASILAIWQIRKEVGLIFTSKLIIAFLALEILVGVLMDLFNFPFLSQPLHLLLACLLFASYIWLLLSKRRLA